MKTYAKRSTYGFIQLWITIVLPPLFVLAYLWYINFDFSLIETSYWIIGILLLVVSLMYGLIFGDTMFMPKTVVEGDHEGIYIHLRKNKVETIGYLAVIDIVAVNNYRTILRSFSANRSFGKLMIKTADKTYKLYPIKNVEFVKGELDKICDKKRKTY